MPVTVDISTCRTLTGRCRDKLSVESPYLNTAYHMPWDCTLFTELVRHVAYRQKLATLRRVGRVSVVSKDIQPLRLSDTSTTASE
jgi:hypothetical protein